ncbi:FRU male-specific P1 isoform, partial [Penaeus vannamei]
MASLSSERQLRFRWNDHMQHVSKVLTLQRLEEQFCDVTLVSDDGFVMKAHQAILASTSAYFQRVLSEVASDQYPMIVLRGAKFREMSCLLDYMYQGNTQ